MVRLTPEQWESVLPWLHHFKPHSVVAARAVLVDGKTLREAAKPYGITRQALHQTVERILTAEDRVRQSKEAGSRKALPAGWVTVSFDMPERHVPAAREFIEALCARSSPLKARKGNSAPRPSRSRGTRAR
ncbi:MAG: TrfB plasmid transcriptional repressor [Gammaproteobacteria bacterium]|nr:TrfB plasmid transcriptional repressor [Gammaproteobacteria bacterium]